MARQRPFLFCGFEIAPGKDQKGIPPFAYLKVLGSLQGKIHSYGRKAEEAGIHDSVTFRSREFKVEHYLIVTWSVGQIIDVRQRAIYDEDRDDVKIEFVKDGSIKYTDFVACPGLGILAVDDRGGDIHLGGRAAINRFRSMAREVKMEARIESTVTPKEVAAALKKWQLTTYSFVVEPVNPHPPGELSKLFSEAMRAEGIGEFRGTAKPVTGSFMKPADGPIATTAEISDAGYGQLSLRGYSEAGVEAEIKKPKFFHDPKKNEQAQEKLRELRIFIEEADDKTDEQINEEVARALVEFRRGQ
jgi:hypothetical protein